MLDQKLIEEIQKKADIVQIISSYLTVTKKGKNHVALCPFHDDKNPSLSISQDKQIFKCFVCGQGGTVFQFIQAFEKVSFLEAVKKIADRIGLQDPRLSQYIKPTVIDPKLEPYYKVNQDLADFYAYGLLTEEGKKALTYLASRGIEKPIIDKFKIGYALDQGSVTVQYLIAKKGYTRTLIEQAGIGIPTGKDLSDRLAGRVIFPILNPDGKVVGFSGRVLEKSTMAKYVNSPETPIFQKSELLYNYSQAKLSAKRANHLYVLEGFMDVIALARANVEAAVAIMGTALTKKHLQLLKGLGVEVRLCLDADDAGQAATMKLLSLFDQARIPYRLVDTFQQDKDPDEILQTSGEESLKLYLNTLLNRVDFSMKYFAKKPLRGTEERVAFVKHMVPILAETHNVLEFEDYTKRMGQLTGFPQATIKKYIEQFQSNRTQEPSERVMQEVRPIKAVLKRFQLAEKSMLYLMIHDIRAVDYYKKNIEYFYDEIYRKLANYLMEYLQQNPTSTMGLSGLMSYLESLEIPDKKPLMDVLTEMSFEKYQTAKFDLQTLADFKKAIDDEKSKMLEEARYEKSVEGKDEQEKARILHEKNKQKHIQAAPKKEGKNDGKK